MSGAGDTGDASPSDSAHEQRVAFDSTLTYQASVATRVFYVAVALILFVLLAVLQGAARSGTHARDHHPILNIVSCCILAIAIMALLQTRVKFVFGQRGLILHGVLRTSREIPYADLVQTSIARTTSTGRYSRSGYTLTFRSLSDVTEPLSFFASDSDPLGQAIVERLRHLPGFSSQDPATLREHARRS